MIGTTEAIKPRLISNIYQLRSLAIYDPQLKANGFNHRVTCFCPGDLTVLY